ncbi:Carboxyl-terminal peptidase [Citrus sinensis]|uniref:Carboxyl-terminal peptidase n=1 Tax=Citrus sinensis TaxID=2711 RepID=A0ACB8LIU5_CITSI|nr:Carboxyl-terminal peptidase [Citrus sinensis]
MTSSSCCKISPIIPIFVSYLLVLSSSICLVHSSDTGKNLNATNQTTLRPEEELHKLKFIRAHLNKINKPASPDGDIIDCVETHLQPAFDHPKLKGQRPLDPPARPNGHNPSGMITEEFQLWSFSGESCPEGTIPIRRTTEQDVLRATSVRKFGRKKIRRVRRDTNSNGHEVSPELYGDNYPRFFTYWTTDAYQATGCYNLLCSGFVQTNNRIAIGAAISPTSSYNGGQFDISLLIWKDPKHGNWWLEFGSGVLVGYWPSFLFTHLTDHASMVQFGGEIVNSRPSGFHTSTQMGSGHFAGEGFGKASYFRNLQVVDWDNNLIPLSNLRVLADHPNCYDIQGGINRVKLESDPLINYTNFRLCGVNLAKEGIVNIYVYGL